MADIRIVVPLKWDSDLRKELFKILQEKGYKWSGGDPLSLEREKYQNMAYVAIYAVNPYIRYSSHIEMLNKPVSDCGYNYILPSNVKIKQILKSLVYVKTLLSEDPAEYKIDNFVTSHHELKDWFLT